MSDTNSNFRELENSDWALEPIFKKALFRSGCLSADELMLFRWGMLDKPKVDAVRQHLESCRACAQEISLFLPSAKAQNPTAADLFDTAAKLWRVLVASLVPSAGLTYGAVRSGQPQSKALVYELDDLGWEISINQQTKALGYQLAGQILADELPLDSQIHLVQDNHILQSTTPNASDSFIFQPVEAGRYAIWIEFADTQVQLPDIVCA
ncbi:MAG: hypothetical protein KIH69_003300 [Anaerolineae bacterium]|nr:hypothetical protein [Anaerolineae bacterium]